jgi:hypothetical protein
MQTPSIERCDGAKSNTPEAELCRKCKRAEAGKSMHQSFILPAVRTKTLERTHAIRNAHPCFITPVVRVAEHFDFGPTCTFFVPIVEDL